MRSAAATWGPRGRGSGPAGTPCGCSPTAGRPAPPTRSPPWSAAPRPSSAPPWPGGTPRAPTAWPTAAAATAAPRCCRTPSGANCAPGWASDPPDGGPWSGPKVAAFARERFGVDAWPQAGWDWLRKLGFSLKVPRPRHPKAADAGGRRRWAQRLTERVARLRAGNPGKAVEVWVQDEARPGLKPVTRRVWTLKG